MCILSLVRISNTRVPHNYFAYMNGKDCVICEKREIVFKKTDLIHLTKMVLSETFYLLPEMPAFNVLFTYAWQILFPIKIIRTLFAQTKVMQEYLILLTTCLLSTLLFLPTYISNIPTPLIFSFIHSELPCLFWALVVASCSNLFYCPFISLL